MKVTVYSKVPHKNIIFDNVVQVRNYLTTAVFTLFYSDGNLRDFKRQYFHLERIEVGKLTG